MSETKNPLFEDLEAKNQAEKNEIIEAPPQLVTEEEMSQLRKHQMELKKDPAVLQLAEKIDVKNQIAVLEFGKETATAISKFSDRMLASIKQSKLEKSSELINNLNKIMARFEPEDFKEEKKGFFSRLFGKGKEQLQKILAKYDTMNKEIDAIYQEITKYEMEMKKNTVELEQMYDQNLDYFKSLSEHIAAIEVKVKS